MGYLIDTNAKNVWVRDHADTEDLSVQTSASSVYFNNGRTMEQEFGKGAMVSNVATVESGMDSVIEGTYDGTYEYCQMQGRSLVNLFNSKQVTPSLHFSNNNNGKYENITKSNGLIEFDIVGSENLGDYQYINMGKVNVDLLKPNTRYLVLFEEITGIDTVSVRDGNSANTVIDYTKVGGKQYVILTTLSEWQKSNQILYLYVQSKTGIHVKVKNAMIIEYQEGMENWDIPYFEGLCDSKMPILKNVGKNLLDESTLEVGGLLWATGEKHDATDRRRSDFIKVAPNTSYIVSFYNSANGTTGYFEFNKNKQKLKHSVCGISAFTFTTSSDTYFVRLVTPLEGQVMLEEATSTTPHEDYKTSILTTPEGVILRKVGDVCDSYDALTGEYVQRIGETVLTEVAGLSNGSFITETHETYIQSISGVVNSSAMICDKLPVNGYPYSAESMECICINSAGNQIAVRVAKSRYASYGSFNEYLAENPITIQYQLATPIATVIEPSTIPFVYENGHIILESGHEGQSLLPTLEYSTTINRTGQIQSIANTVQKQEKQITKLEQMLIQNIVDLDYNNTLLALGLEINEVI